MKITMFIAFYDFWVGVFWQAKKRVIYICLLPCVVIKIQLKDKGAD